MAFCTVFRNQPICVSICLRRARLLLAASLLVLLGHFPLSSAHAQAVNQLTNSTAGVISDLSCNQPVASQIVRTFTVTANYTVRDMDVGILLDHTYRSDLRIFLTSPGGTTVTVMTWTGNVQGGDNLNDQFDDEAAAVIGDHVAGAIDPLTPVPPLYSHGFRPSSPLSAFDGQNANGVWTLRICDAVGSDAGNFRRADLFITQPVLAVTKSSSVVSDGISASNPKAIPGSIVRYCVLMTNTDSIAMANISPTDALPANTTYISGSMRSGTSCAGATTIEDDNAVGADESDPFGSSVTGTTITGTAAALPAGGSFAVVFNVSVN
jgi:uncharacterized repeat protein (TIGR01451 family)